MSIKTLLKILTILGNTGILLFLVYFAITEGGLEKASDKLSFFAILILLVLNIYFVSKSGFREKGWIGLWFERKALEEKKKIKNLKS